MDPIYHDIFRLLYISLALATCTSEQGIESKESANAIKNAIRRCPYKLRKLWQADISSFPFAAPPLVSDVDGDGGLDVVAAPFGEALAVIEGETGRHLHDTSWPQHNLDKSMHSTPLQYDIDGNGLLDLVFLTTQGEALFYTGLGQSLHSYTFQLGPAYVRKDSFDDVTHVSHEDVGNYVLSEEKSSHVPVDVHVLSSPALYDMQFLVVPVSYFYSPEDYESVGDSGPWGDADARERYFVTGVAIIDLERLRSAKINGLGIDKKILRTVMNVVFLELSQIPVFNLFTPTVMDLDGVFGDPEVVTGTSSGKLFVVSMDGQHRNGFPKSVGSGSISGTIAAANLDSDVGLELIVMSTSGEVLCVSSQSGRIKWSGYVTGTSFPGSRILDVDVDGQLDVVIASEDGNIFALHGLNGTALPNYPYKIGKGVSGNVLVTKFNALSESFDLMFLSNDGVLHVLASDHSCSLAMSLGDTSLVDIVSHDLVLLNRGMEFLISTADGSLICVGSGVETPVDELIEVEFRLNWKRLATSFYSTSMYNFAVVMNKATVMIEDKYKGLKEVTGSSFDLQYSVYSQTTEKFDLFVYMGSDVVRELKQISSSSEPSWLRIPTLEQPGQAQVSVVIYDKYGFVSTDFIFLKFNQLIMLDLQWLVLAPFIAMVIILLVNHGFPAKDLLPVTFPGKSK